MPLAAGLGDEGGEVAQALAVGQAHRRAVARRRPPPSGVDQRRRGCGRPRPRRRARRDRRRARRRRGWRRDQRRRARRAAAPRVVARVPPRPRRARAASSPGRTAAAADPASASASSSTATACGRLPGRGQRTRSGTCRAGGQRRDVEAGQPGVQIGARRLGAGLVATGELGVDEHGEQLGRPQRVGAEGAEAAPRRRRSQLVVAAGEVQAGGGQEGLHVRGPCRAAAPRPRPGGPGGCAGRPGRSPGATPASAARGGTRRTTAGGPARPRPTGRARRAAWRGRCRSGWTGRPGCPWPSRSAGADAACRPTHRRARSRRRGSRR